MFDPMFVGMVETFWTQWGMPIVLGISLILWVAGMYWIYRISKDIEDN